MTQKTDSPANYAGMASFGYDDLLRCAHGDLFGQDGPRLPLPPMLMFDRITKITSDGGKYGRGMISAEFEIKPEAWFFKCHFDGDPVMPGCLGLDALWQLIGFFLGWTGAKGSGRALGVGKVRFSGQILPGIKQVKYQIDFKRILSSRLVMGIGDGHVLADGAPIYQAGDLRVGLFDMKNAQAAEDLQMGMEKK